MRKAKIMINQNLGRCLLVALFTIIAGCSTSEKKQTSDAEYYGNTTNSNSLEVPPDLTQTDPNRNVQIPTTQEGDSTAPTTGVLSNRNVLAQPGNVKMLRDGQQRWLLVDGKPADIWPQLVNFWTDDGIELVINDAASGVLETDWLINYADLTSSFQKLFRGLLNKVSSAGERDKYRFRIDYGTEPNTTEVYVTHQGLEEVSIGPSRTHVPDYKWVKRPSDPGLEIAIMRQLMVYLGVEEERADLIAEQNLPEERETARLLIEGVDDPVLVLDDPFPRAWQRIGLALDRSGYVITGRNRQQGGYLIELADPDAQTDKPGLLGRLFNSKKRDAEEIIYKAQVRLIPQKDKKTVVAVASEEGEHDSSETAISLLRQLYEQLK